MLLVVSSREDIEDTLTWDFYYLTLPKWWCANAHTTSLDDPPGSAREIGKLSELKDCKTALIYEEEVTPQHSYRTLVCFSTNRMIHVETMTESLLFAGVLFELPTSSSLPLSFAIAHS
ncbi:hypothetical protein KQX54_001032 [Cotesia glomerata]|uniref:Uncharacterized protein n=1 Tax=Cotesia glomerata TaxID=32391 RepID=A0AAV7IHY1_COTGL|nr:hypothetical protein KQX54_001032 [Cotesia glomerata]